MNPRRALTAFGLLLALLSWPSAAGAHALLVGTDPADGAILDTAPESVSLEFNESVSARPDGIVIIGPDGAQIDVGEVTAIDREVVIDLPTPLGDGTHTVSWRVTSADSHPMNGAFSFSVGEASGAAAPVVPSTGDDGGLTLEILRAIATTLAYGGALGAAGLLVLRRFLHDGEPDRLRLDRLTRWASVVGIVGVAAVVPLQVITVVGTGFGGVADGPAWSETLRGPVGIAAIVSILGLAGMIVTTTIDDDRWSVRALAATAAFISVGGFVIAGHTRSFGPAWLMISADLVHVVTGALWFGGILGLRALLDARSGRHDDVLARSTTAIVSRFSGVATVSLLAVVAVGVVLTWRILGSWSGLLTTGYGRALVIKVELVLVAAALGAANRFLLSTVVERGHRPVHETLRRIIRTEAVVLVAVIAAAGVLVNRSPVDGTAEPAGSTTGPPGAAAPASTGGTGSGPEPVNLEVELGDLQAEIEVEPARRGTNRIAIRLLDGDEPAEVLEPPVLALTEAERGIGPLTVDTVTDDDGLHRAEIDLPVEGTWNLRIDVRISDFDKPISVTDFDVTE